MEEIENFLISEIKKILHLETELLFDAVIKICEDYYNKPVYCLADLNKRNTKLKGDIFECLAKLYLENVYGLTKVWYYKELPDEIKEKLKLSKTDMGIDLIGQDTNGKYYAIQAKYRKRNPIKKVCVTWKQLSTFYALCLKTGPYNSHIVFTTADYVRHIGKKTQKDKTITNNTLKNLSKFDWIYMCGPKGLRLNSGTNTNTNTNTNSVTFNIEEMRNKRLQKFLN